ncbi:MAG: aromatic amino acid lyase [Deltaproteobacteria bacterium]|nr:aromatic amino acid lyase [Deltaproteobacteria bacterium]
MTDRLPTKKSQNPLVLGGGELPQTLVWEFARQALSPTSTIRIKLSPEAVLHITKSRTFIDSLVKSGQIIYGIDTGVGFLNHKTISDTDLEKLQRNIIVSHCCGTGPELSRDLVMACG